MSSCSGMFQHDCICLISNGQKENFINLDIVRKRDVELPLIYSNFIWYKIPCNLNSLKVQSNCGSRMWRHLAGTGLDQSEPLAQEVL